VPQGGLPLLSGDDGFTIRIDSTGLLDARPILRRRPGLHSIRERESALILWKAQTQRRAESVSDRRMVATSVSYLRSLTLPARPKGTARGGLGRGRSGLPFAA